jgi:thiol-disulfide isomerase/thioredoxin
MGKKSRSLLFLYGRSYCHLCEDMRVALEPWRDAYGFSIEVRDVDSNPDWLERYDQLVPVLTLGEAEICHYFLDVERLRAALAPPTN